MKETNFPFTETTKQVKAVRDHCKLKNEYILKTLKNLEFQPVLKTIVVSRAKIP
jgi:hypothetical protein